MDKYVDNKALYLLKYLDNASALSIFAQNCFGTQLWQDLLLSQKKGSFPQP